MVSQRMAAPRTPHWDGVMLILMYLKIAPGRGLLYRDHGRLEMKGYEDADFG